MASVQPESGRIIISDFTSHLVRFFQRRPGSHYTKLIRIKSRWPGFAQTNLVWKQAREQQSSSLEYNWPATSFPVSLGCVLLLLSQIILCKTSLDPIWVWLTVWFWAKWIWSGSKPVCKNHPACFWPILPSQSGLDRIGSGMFTGLMSSTPAMSQQVNPFTAAACSISGLKSSHIRAPENSILDGPITNLLSILCLLIEVLSRAHAKRRKGPINFKFGTLIDKFFQVTARQAWH